MSTRSKARNTSAAVSKQAAQPSVSAKRGKTETLAPVNNEKANGKAKPVKASAKRGKGKTVAVIKEEKLCPCAKGDDGSPMVTCGNCDVWYHFTCVDLDEEDAGDVSFYVCPTCTKATGLHTTMTWEGPSAFVDPEESNVVINKTKPSKPKPKLVIAPKAMSESDEESSEDDFVMDEDKKSQNVQFAKRRRTAVASGTDSEGSDSDSHKRRKRRLRKISGSPGPNRATDSTKRKASTSEANSAIIKKSKMNPQSAQEDPTRKYCLGKLEELFRDIFFRYPHVQQTQDSSQVEPKPIDGMTDEQKEALTQASRQFAIDLEQAIFEMHADHDKNGNASAGTNYKDRYRTLQYNLSKPDRVVIHQRIASRNIAPKDLSLMSSTDLANEETKQIIKIAEKEALEHSILPKTLQPRAKITHKGIEDIEIDVDAPSTTAPDLEAQRAREKEAEERRERERMARLKGIQRQRTASMSIPPESPTVAQRSTTSDPWGAPPPVPLHAQGSVTGSDQEGGTHTRRPSLPLSLHDGSGSIRYTPEPEPELNMADYIHMDEEPTSSDDTLPTPASPFEAQAGSVDPFAPPPIATTSSTSSDGSLTSGPGHFSAPPPEKSSFNLDALWSGPMEREKDESVEGPADDGEIPMVLSPASQSPPPLQEEEESKVIVNDNVSPIEAHEPDFDMLFEDSAPLDAPQPPVSMESIPQVWEGKLSMPLDSSIPQATHMNARQIAGPPLEPDSILWKTLFPSDHLRIDGRVPVSNSTNYITQMRLNAQRELYAVAFTPSSESDEEGFQGLTDFLVSKGRHGLIFPWGSRPKDYHPGKELYVIPLRAGETIPDYMELLDNLKIPRQRERNYLIGIWVLFRGKLAPLPGVQTSTTPVIIPPAGATTPMSITPTNSLLPTHVPSHVPPHIPARAPTHILTPPHPLQVPTPIQVPPTPVNPVVPAYANLPPGVDPAGLAAEVASLTQEQVQSLIRTLQLTGATLPVPLPQVPAAPPIPTHAPAIPIPTVYPPYPPHPVHPPHSAHLTHTQPPYNPVQPPRQSWPGQGTGSPYSPQQYPAYNDNWSTPSRASSSHAPPPPQHYDRTVTPHHQQGHHPQQQGGDHRGGWCGKNKNRGGGSSGGWDRNSNVNNNQQQLRDNHPRDNQRDGFNRPVDSGWPRKQHSGHDEGYDNRRQW